MFRGLNHVGIVVPQWQEAKHFFVDKLGLVVDRERTPTDDGYYMAAERVRTYHLRMGQSLTRVEVLVPQDTTSGIARYLMNRGPGLHHVCFGSDDVPSDVGRLREQGLQQIDLSRGKGDPQGGEKAAFFHPKSNLGVLIEVSPIYR